MNTDYKTASPTFAMEKFKDKSLLLLVQLKFRHTVFMHVPILPVPFLDIQNVFLIKLAPSNFSLSSPHQCIGLRKDYFQGSAQFLDSSVYLTKLASCAIHENVYHISAFVA
jgi:hypothetical protein